MATGTEIERLFVKIEGDIAGLKTSMGKAIGEVDRAEKAMGSSLAKLSRQFNVVGGELGVTLPAGAAAAAAAVLAASKVALSYADNLGDTAAALGINVEKLQELRFAAVQAGVAQEEMDKALMKLNVAIGDAARNGGPAADKFAKLGIAVTDASGQTRDTGAIFTDLVGRLSKMPSAAERASAAADVLGDKLGPKLNALLGQGTAALDASIAKARQMGAVIDESLIKRASAAQDELDALSTVTKAQLTVALADLAPVLLTVATGIATIARGAAVAATALRAMFGAEAAPLEADIRNLQERIAGVNLELANSERIGDTEAVARYKEQVRQLTGVLEIYRDRQKEALGLGPVRPPLTADTPAIPVDEVAQRKVQQAEARAYAERLTAQKALLENLANNEQAGLDRRLQAIESATQLSVQMETSAYESKLAELQGLDAKTDEMRAGRQRAIEEAEAAHQLRIIDIEADGRERARALADADHAAERARLEERRSWFEQQVEEDRDRQQQTAEANAAFAQQNIRLNQEGLNEMVRLREEDLVSAEQLEMFKQQIEQQRYSAAKGALGALSTLMASQSRKQFEIGKTAAIAETILNTYEAAQKAYTALADIPYVGPALGAAAAAAALAGGLARVQAIRNTSFGSRSVAVGVGNNVAVGTGGGSGAPGNGSGGSSSSIFINLKGSELFSGDAVRQLIERINQAQGDGSRIRVVS